MKKANQTEIVVAQVLQELSGERWELLRQKLRTKGLRALIAETTLEEARVIQEKVAETKRMLQPLTVEDNHSLYQRLQQALQKGIEQSTAMSWPSLHKQSFEA